MQPVSLPASGSRAAAGLPRDASAPGQDGVSEPEKLSQPARLDRRHRTEVESATQEHTRVSHGGRDARRAPREGQAWHLGPALHSGRSSLIAHPRRPARPVHPPAPVTRDSPVASRPRGWTTTEDTPADGHTRPSGLEEPPVPSSKQRQAAYPGPRQVCSWGAPLSTACVWAATLRFGSQNITTGVSPAETSRLSMEGDGKLHYKVTGRANIGGDN